MYAVKEKDSLGNINDCIERLAYWAYINRETIKTNQAIYSLMVRLDIQDGSEFLTQLISYQEATYNIARSDAKIREFSSQDLPLMVGTRQDVQGVIESLQQIKKLDEEKLLLD